MRIPQFLTAVLGVSIALVLSGCATTPNEQFNAGQQAYHQHHYAKAFHDTLLAAQGGSLKAQYAVGYMSYYGIGTPRNTFQAYTWMERAASWGYGKAISALKLMERHSPQQVPPHAVTSLAPRHKTHKRTRSYAAPVQMRLPKPAAPYAARLPKPLS